MSGLPLVADGIEIVDQRKDFRLRLFALEERHDLFVHGTRLALVVHHVEQRVQFGDRLQPAVGGQHVHPLGKEQIDLRVIFLQRSEAGGVPLHVERSTNAFVGVQYHLRRGPLGFAVRVQPARRLALLAFLKSVIGLLDLGQGHARNRRSANDGRDKKHHQQRDDDHAGIEHQP